MILTKTDSDDVENVLFVSYSACKLFYIIFSQSFHTLPWWAAQRPRSSSRRRETIVLRSVFVWRCRCLKCHFRNFAGLRGLRLKSSQGWVYMQAVRVCLCTEIVLDTQLVGVPWPTLALCHHASYSVEITVTTGCWRLTEHHISDWPF